MKGLRFAALVLACCCVFTQAEAASSCLPGLPCVDPLTLNDPADPADGPNQPGAPNEPKTDSGACDADFMNQIYARAFLEAQREIIMNEVVIRKPDSVLEYTCFDQFLKNTADYAGPLFTESTRWQSASVPNPGAGNISISVSMGGTKLDESLNKVVMDSLNNYVDKNFAHDFLGGALAGENNTIATAVSSAGSVCDFMNNVYFEAKCNDFALDDQFMTFAALVSTDPRSLPDKCTGGTGITTDWIDVANNKDFKYAAFDKQETYLDFLDPAACKPPVPTGLIVKQDDFEYDEVWYNFKLLGTDEFADHFCINPGCHFEKGKCVP
ncbi:MAG: hypothetical protein ACPGRX_03850 [Bdellovibrionales bacterium]